jgi:hypothetical protein
MAMTWGQLKAVATASALPDTAQVLIELDLAAGTTTPPVPGYVASTVSFQKTVDAAVVQAGKLIWS